MLWLVPVLLSTVLTVSPGTDPLLSSPERRVRSTDKRLAQLLQIGLQRSPTFAEMVQSLNRTDVIVYIERSNDLPRTLAGRLLLLPMTGQYRYLRIQVRGDLPTRELIALIGHELRHALEIAEEPGVRDASTMLTFYQRIGHPTSGVLHTYDTDAAQTVGDRVRLELS
jgi:hypothetical protein